MSCFLFFICSWGDPADVSNLPDGPFDIVYDNNAKKLDVCKAAIDKYKVPLCLRGTLIDQRSMWLHAWQGPFMIHIE